MAFLASCSFYIVTRRGKQLNVGALCFLLLSGGHRDTNHFGANQEMETTTPIPAPFNHCITVLRILGISSWSGCSFQSEKVSTPN